MLYALDGIGLLLLYKIYKFTELIRMFIDDLSGW